MHFMLVSERKIINFPLPREQGRKGGSGATKSRGHPLPTRRSDAADEQFQAHFCEDNKQHTGRIEWHISATVLPQKFDQGMPSL